MSESVDRSQKRDAPAVAFRGIRRLAVVLGIGLLTASCALRASDTPTTVSGQDVPPTELAQDADESIRVVPDGYADCGTTLLSSGWPTTTAYLPEVSASCIVEAVATGNRAQYSYTQRDNAGGIQGTIVRVEGQGSVTELSYTVDAEGNSTTVRVTCASLLVADFAPPVCDAG